MRIVGHKRLNSVLAILFFVALVALWKVAWHDTHAMWDVRDARIAVRRIEKNRHTALHGTPQEAASCLRDIVTCYTPWKWQRADLHLGQLVEDQRAAAVRDVIEYLRGKTGDDLDSSAESWIKKYGSKQ